MERRSLKGEEKSAFIVTGLGATETGIHEM